MRIVKAKKNDLKFLLQVYNFYVQKKLFSTNRKIKYLDHKKWFEKNYLKEKNIYIFISKIKKVKIGYVRYSNVKKNIFEVSLALKNNFIGLGLGKKMLNLSLKKFLIKKKLKIISKVKKDNKKSISCFLKNNFKKLKTKNKFFNKLENVNKYYFFKYVDK